MLNTHRTSGRRFAVASLVAIGLLVAACGSDDDSSSDTDVATDESAPSDTGGSTDTASTDTATDDGGSGDAAAVVAEYTVVPTEIVQTEPLSAAPDPKKVTFIVCADPSCVVLADYLKDATAALGWEFTSINAPATDFGSAVQQAIDTQPDFIAGTGTDAAAFQPQYDAMQEAGIPYFTCYATDVPAGEENNLYANCYDSSAAQAYSKVLVDWIINDSGGAANALIVDLPAFPILSAQADGAEAAFEACSGCTVQSLDLTIDDLTSGGTANAIISFLQSNPDINYLYLTYSGFEPGLPAALESAGLSDKVKIVGTQAGQGQLQAIIDGTEAAWTALPQEYAMWTLADQMARVANGEWDSANERTNAIPPFFIVDTPDAATALVDLDNGWPGPEGFQDAFKQLWGV